MSTEIQVTAVFPKGAVTAQPCSDCLQPTTTPAVVAVTLKEADRTLPMPMPVGPGVVYCQLCFREWSLRMALLGNALRLDQGAGIALSGPTAFFAEQADLAHFGHTDALTRELHAALHEVEELKATAARPQAPRRDPEGSGPAA